MSRRIGGLPMFEKRIARRPKSKRVICFGDSWFQLPGLSSTKDDTDIHKGLSSKYRNASKRSPLFLGQGVAGRNRASFSIGMRSMKRLIHELEIDFLLISHGGNDVIGQEFAVHLKCPDEPQDIVNPPFPRPIPKVVREYLKLGTFDQSLQAVRADLEDAIVLRDHVRPECKIVLHNYSQITPADRPWRFRPFPIGRGPWVSNYLKDVGLEDPDKQRKVSNWMLQQFSLRLKELVHDYRVKNVFLVDSESILGDISRSTELWVDEIHPSPVGVRLLVEKGWSPLLEAEGILDARP